MSDARTTKSTDALFPGEDPYASVCCPMPGCAGELWINYSLSAPVYYGSTAEALADTAGAYTQSWDIGCTEGHTLLLPNSHADDTERFQQECYTCAPDEGASNTAVWHDDMARLLSLLASLRASDKDAERHEP